MKNMLQRQFMTSEHLYPRGRTTRYSILASSLQLKYDFAFTFTTRRDFEILSFSFSGFFYP